MKKKFLLAIFFSVFVFISGCDTDCQATTINVGRRNSPIMLVDSDSGRNAGIAVTDDNGNVTVPCGQEVGYRAN